MAPQPEFMDELYYKSYVRASTYMMAYLATLSIMSGKITTKLRIMLYIDGLLYPSKQENIGVCLHKNSITPSTGSYFLKQSFVFAWSLSVHLFSYFSVQKTIQPHLFWSQVLFSLGEGVFLHLFDCDNERQFRFKDGHVLGPIHGCVRGDQTFFVNITDNCVVPFN